MGFVKITSGKLRGRKVITPAGAGTRPLLTRLRKSFADILRPQLPGIYVLDLFAGSGAIVFELLSNGAAGAVMVEINPKTADLISRNTRDLGLEADVEIIAGDSIEAVGTLAAKGRLFNIIVVAPPYGLGLQQKALDALAAHKLLKKDGLIIVQREKREPVAEAAGGLHLVRTKDYGKTIFDFFQ